MQRTRSSLYVLHKSIASLQGEEWRDDMNNEEVDSVQIPDARVDYAEFSERSEFD